MRRRIRAWLLYRFFQPRNYAELMDTALSLFPSGGQVDEDLDGQLLVYTGLTHWLPAPTLDGYGSRGEELRELA